MQPLMRLLQIALTGLCVGLLATIVGEVTFSGSDLDVSSNDAAPGTAATLPADAPALDVDALVATILERPLFTRGRLPAPVAGSSLPQLQARLAGIMIGPQSSEALFEREGEKPLAVAEQQEIDGWTVISIAADRIVLKSALGEHVLKPTPLLPPNGRPATPLAASLPHGANVGATAAAKTTAGAKTQDAPAARSDVSAKVVP